MSELSKEVVSLLNFLAPGFIVAWIYFGLTSYAKPSQFERVVQALIFTVAVQAIVSVERWFLLLLGNVHSFGVWTQESGVFASLLTAIGFGLLVVSLARKDAIHRASRRLGVTTRSGHPCEWFSILAEYPRYIVLQLKDGSRIYGWPTMWPSNPENGHFFITNAVRTVEEQEQDLPHLEGLMISAADVSYVEFAKTPGENCGKSRPEELVEASD